VSAGKPYGDNPFYHVEMVEAIEGPDAAGDLQSPIGEQAKYTNHVKMAGRAVRRLSLRESCATFAEQKATFRPTFFTQLV
jgi:hypothetical protein